MTTQSKAIFVIEGHTGYQWEPIPEGEFSSMEAAEAAIAELVSVLGWDEDKLRIIIQA